MTLVLGSSPFHPNSLSPTTRDESGADNFSYPTIKVSILFLYGFCLEIINQHKKATHMSSFFNKGKIKSCCNGRQYPTHHDHLFC
jgi:hypothetical protein